MESQSKSGERLAAAWQEIRSCLERHRERIYAQIKDYPTPITACDQQFNYLLDERTSVCRELDLLKSAAEGCSLDGDRVDRIQAFIDSSGYVDDAARQRIRVLLGPTAL